MSRRRGSVRIGPISLFTLIIALCLTVLSVLAVTTAQAAHAAANKQALFTHDTYSNESEAQSFLADIDAALGTVRAANGGSGDALAAVVRALPDNAELDGSTVRAWFAAESGRRLDVELTIRANATYEIVSWKATTQWTDDGSSETLWPGAAQTR